ncbi:MAG: TIGR03936 family radical SAM-associated protein [Pelolinea sp.]|nr:TIGR03936 family radical SAM-associated protein [Pelolinea sp.]
MRLRITFQKTGEIIYTSSLDLQKIWERSLRRAQLVVKYSEGFHPQPKMQLAVPLPLGFNGKEELIDLWFIYDYSKEEILERLRKALPDGIELISIDEIPENQKALNGLAESAEYIVTIIDAVISTPYLEKSIHCLLVKKDIVRERNKKSYDLRPLILSMELCKSNSNQPQIHMHLLARSGASGRPDEVVKELGIDPALCEIERIRINFKK